MIDAHGRDPIRDLLRDAQSAGQLPGASWRVERASVVLSEGALGFACLTPTLVEAVQATPYDLASLTKPLATALLALGLESEGRLDLRAPAASWVDELQGSPYESATLLELGSHRAGLPSWKPLYLEASDLGGFLSAIARTPPAAPRGTTLYSDLGYVVLGAAVERAAGSSLAELFEARIARPLGLAHTGYARRPSDYPDAAATENGNAYERSLAGAAGSAFPWRTSVIRGEVHDGNAHALGGVAGHAGLFGPAADVAAIAREMLHRTGVVTSSRASELLLQPVDGQGSRTFGLCLAVESKAALGVLPDAAPGHTGFTGASVWLVPEEDLVLVLLANRVHPLVREVDFQPLRLEFHRRALEMARRR